MILHPRAVPWLLILISALPASAFATVGEDTTIEVLGYDEARGVVLMARCWRTAEPTDDEGTPPLPLHEGCALDALDVASGAIETEPFAPTRAFEARVRAALSRLRPLPRLSARRARLSVSVDHRYARYQGWPEAEVDFTSLDVTARVGPLRGTRAVEAFEHEGVEVRAVHRLPAGLGALVIVAYRGDTLETGYDVDAVVLAQPRSARPLPAAAAAAIRGARITALSTRLDTLSVQVGERWVELPFSTEAECRTQVDAAIDASEARAIGDAPHRVALRGGRLSGRHGVLYDPAPFLCGQPNEAPTDQRSIRVSQLAAEGSLVSLRAEQSVAAAGGPPYHEERWLVFDLRDGRPTSIEALIAERRLDEEALVRALIDDPFVRARGGISDGVSSYREAVVALGAIGIAVESGAFAIVGSRPSGAVNVHLAVSSPGDDPPHLRRVTRLGLWLPLRVPGLR